MPGSISTIRCVVCMCTCGACVYVYTHIYVYRNIERRVSSTEIRSVYICRQPSSRCPLPPAPPPPPAFSSLCMNHDALVSSPWNRFFVSSTFVESSSRRERNHPLTLRRGATRDRRIRELARGRESERKRACERAERAKREPVRGTGQCATMNNRSANRFRSLSPSISNGGRFIAGGP